MSASHHLGPLESQVMHVLWTHGEGSVHDVQGRLEGGLAYTTIMTTLDRLFKKGLLTRRREDRAFLYTPALDKSEWERQVAHKMITGYLRGPAHLPDLLASSLVDALGQHDEMLLDELERKIQKKRRELSRKGRA